MTRDPHDDPATRQLLRAALERGAAATDGCLDAATAAAWADGSVDRVTRRAIEAHAADCVRCQALLSAMVRTMPAQAPSAAISWRMLRWAVPPVGLLAIAAIVWAVRPARPPAAVSQSVSTEPLARSAEANRVSSNEPAQPSAVRPSVPPADAAGRTGRARGEGAGPSSPRAAAPPVEAHGRTAMADSFDALEVPKAAAKPKAKEAKPAPANQAQPLREAAPLPQGTPAPMAKAAARPAAIEVASPDPQIRWRIVAGAAATVVERTTDAGATWTTEDTNGAAVTAGAAPSPSVCWLAGRNGAVLVTSDGGRTWRSAGFPERVDLTGIAAVDALHASVTSSDGRRFTTSDGGQTWTRLQENVAAPFQD